MAKRVKEECRSQQQKDSKGSEGVEHPVQRKHGRWNKTLPVQGYLLSRLRLEVVEGVHMRMY